MPQPAEAESNFGTTLVQLLTPLLAGAKTVDDAQLRQAVSAAVTSALDTRQQSDELKHLQEEVLKWQSAADENHRHHLETMIEKCPGCQQKMSDAIKNAQHEAVTGALKTLTRQQIRELARQHGDWPPPTIEFPAGLGRQGIRR